ncbi:hypothetical protein [Streptomyces sp. NPDC005408]|uniref:hypothetical protein n=1 Tax=Streptomyces sp. NPDC005408 TaxID=3155341 RepID=UPI0033B8C58C
MATLLSLPRDAYPVPVRCVAGLGQLLDAEAVKYPLGVLLLDRVVHAVEVTDAQISTLDVSQVGFKAEVDVLLVAVPGRAGEGLLIRSSPFSK